MKQIIILLLISTSIFAQEETVYQFENVRVDKICQQKTYSKDLVTDGFIAIVDSSVIMVIEGEYFQYHIDMILEANDESTKYFLKDNGGVLTIYSWWILHVKPSPFEVGCMGISRNEFIIKR